VLALNPMGIGSEVAEVRRALDEALDRVRAEVLKPPSLSTVCHYTTEAGLRGVLSSKKIWATQALGHSTDKRELKHADGAICKVATALSHCREHTREEREWLADLAKRWRINSLTKTANNQLFIACFCPSNDNPKTWNDYADGGKGYALEFEIVPDTPTTPDLGLGWFEVGYTAHETERRLETMFRKSIEVGNVYRRCNPIAAQEHPRWVVKRSFWLVAATTAAITKTSIDRADHELRMLALRTGNAFPVFEGPRRVEIPLRAHGAQPQLRAVHVGPRAPKEAEALVDSLLVQNDYPEDLRARVTRSRVVSG
jgi:hypothetical protein